MLKASRRLLVRHRTLGSRKEGSARPNVFDHAESNLASDLLLSTHSQRRSNAIPIDLLVATDFPSAGTCCAAQICLGVGQDGLGGGRCQRRFCQLAGIVRNMDLGVLGVAFRKG